MKHTHQEGQGFLSEDEIDRLFLGAQGAWFNKSDKNKKRIASWFKKDNDHTFLVPHHEKIGGYDCDHLVDERMKWTLTLPTKVNPIITSGEGYGTANSENQFLFKSRNTSVYFTAASPYHAPQIMRIIVTEKFPVLIPVYLTVTSKQENPSLDTEVKLNDLIKKDLGGIKQSGCHF